MHQTHRGACHCGSVAFELDADIGQAMDCNCSLCRMRGALWHGAREGQLRIVAGEDALTRYQFGTRTAQHFFCRHCGVAPFSHPRIAPANWVVNLRCVEGVDLETLKITRFDGLHYEEAARAWLAAQAKAAGKAA